MDVIEEGDPKSGKNDIQLTFTEIEIMKLVANGLSTKQIAIVTRFKESSVESYRMRLMKKTGVRNSPELVSFGYKKGILSVDPSGD
jgi:DNA-binding CsgD family transcriptional regulator